MTRIRDEAAYQQAMREWVVPPCLHIPVAAEDEHAIRCHIGDVVKVLSPGKAFVVAIDAPPERDNRLPIWREPGVDVFFDRLQIWVHVDYTRYRQAFVREKGEDSVRGKVLAHVRNRRSIKLRGYNFVRIVPVSRGANSSSGFTEQWGMKLAAVDNGALKRTRGLKIQYADLGDLLVMLDMKLGGGVQEVFRVAQNLIEIPGVRPPQA